jgi:hypothetical protein
VNRSRTTPAFREQLARLPPAVRQAARKAYALWENNPHHPSLNFKKLDGEIYSVRVAYRWRAVARKEGDTFVWFFIGSHASYDDLGRR